VISECSDIFAATGSNTPHLSEMTQMSLLASPASPGGGRPQGSAWKPISSSCLSFLPGNPSPGLAGEGRLRTGLTCTPH